MIRRMIRLPMGTSREDVAASVCKLLEAERFCGMKMLPSIGRGDFSRKAGLYVIYAADQRHVLYVGQVKDKANSSVIARIRSHLKTFSETIDRSCFYKFCQFENLTEWQLGVVERLAILELRPELNDGIPSQKKIGQYEWVI